MKQYLLSIYQPDGEIPTLEVLEKISGDVQAVQEEMRAAGAWVFSGGLHPPSTATVLDPRSDQMPMTDGPYVEGKEHVGGFTIIKAEGLDEALAWGRKVARATTLPVEVRPFKASSTTDDRVPAVKRSTSEPLIRGDHGGRWPIQAGRASFARSRKVRSAELVAAAIAAS